MTNQETTFKKSAGVYIKSLFNSIQGTFYLTSKRFMFCKRSGLFNAAAGPLLMHLVKGKDLVFEINLEDLKSINSEKQGFGSKYIFTDKNEKYALQFMSEKSNWINTIIAAVKSSNPNVVIEQIGDSVKFEHKEIVDSKSMDSDDALSELRKAKNKLELELISQEEYDIIKENLRKFIE